MEEETIDFGGLTAPEIADLLAELGAEVGDDEAAMLRDLILEFGGVHEALEVLETLAQESEAA